MTAKRRRAALHAGAALSLIAALIPPALTRPAAAQDFSNYVVFGDSLVDGGQRIDPGLILRQNPAALPPETLALLNQLPEDARWRYTNRVTSLQYGLPYSDQLAAKLGFDPIFPSTPQTAPGMTAPAAPTDKQLNHAVGGAVASEVRAQISTFVTVPATPYYPTTTEGPGFLRGPNADLAPGALVLVSAGGNDVRDMANVQFDPATRLPIGFRLGAGPGDFVPDATVIMGNVATEMGAAARETVAGVQALRAAGVGLVILPNVPNLARTPETALLDSQAPALAAGLGLPLPTEGPFATPFATIRDAATRAYNAELAAGLAGTSGVMSVDLDGFFSAALENPAAFGFSAGNQGATCYNAAELTGVPCVENTESGFSSAGRNPFVLLFNDGIHPTTAGHAAIADLIVSQLDAGAKVSAAPHLPLGAARDLAAVFEDAAERGARLGGVSAFGAVGASAAEYEPSGEGRGVQGHAGATTALSPQTTIGAGIGYHSLSGEASGAEFDGSAFMGGGFARYDDGRFFGTATLAAGYADLDIDRTSRIGGGSVTNSGSADGWVLGGSVQAGARLLEGPGFAAGPLARLEGWSSSLGGYGEGGPAFSAQSFGDLDARSFRGGIGAFAEARGEKLGARVEALWEHEFADAQDIQVYSGGTNRTVPGRASGDDGLKIGLTALYDTGRFGVVSAGYAARIGDEQSHGVRLGLSMPF